MANILPAIACNLDADVLSAALPLFAAEQVQAIEWSFDAWWKQPTMPSWFAELLHTFGEEHRLIGHGVFFSLFSGKWLPEQAAWLQQLQRLAQEFHFDHVTEHFGFMTGEDFHKGAPLSIPFTNTTLALGIDRLRRIQDACRCPVGLENLAFAYSLEEVKRHGDFLQRLVEPVNGFIILDLHNLYCQIHNFTLDVEAILQCYPLERVREIHLSGGSWDASPLHPTQQIRRDTHDDAVPESVFELLQQTIPRCPHLKYVVLEQLGTALHTEASQQQFRQDFHRLSQIVTPISHPSATEELQTFLPVAQDAPPAAPLEDAMLYAQQLELSSILETAADYADAQAQLQQSSLAHSAWHIERWEPAMLHTALAIAQKWKDGF